MQPKTFADRMLSAYIECALWTELDQSDPNTGGYPLENNYDPKDISADTLKRMHADCADFIETAWELIVDADLSPEQVGHDFWLTRNGHGAGFWDRGLSQIGDELTKLCRPYGEYTLYVGDDGQIWGN